MSAFAGTIQAKALLIAHEDIGVRRVQEPDSLTRRRWIQKRADILPGSVCLGARASPARCQRMPHSSTASSRCRRVAETRPSRMSYDLQVLSVECDDFFDR